MPISKITKRLHTFASGTAIVIFSFSLYSESRADVFECIDAAGNKVFAQICPKGTVSSKEIVTRTVPNGQGSSPAKGANKKSLQELEEEFRKRQQAKEDEREKAKDAEKTQEAKCDADKQRLGNLLNGRPLVVGKDDKNELVYMDDKTREEQSKQVLERLKACH
jgi:hypothetical protein